MTTDANDLPNDVAECHAEIRRLQDEVSIWKECTYHWHGEYLLTAEVLARMYCAHNQLIWPRTPPKPDDCE